MIKKLIICDNASSVNPDHTIRAIRECEFEEPIDINKHYRVKSINFEILKSGIIIQEFKIPFELFDICKNVFHELRDMEYKYLKEKSIAK